MGATYWIWNGHRPWDKGRCGRIGIKLVLCARNASGRLENDNSDISIAYFGAVLNVHTSVDHVFSRL